MLRTLRISILTSVFLGVFLCAQGFAAGSGAYRLEVPDAAALAVGGAVVGQANTPVAVYFNPAGMTQIKKAAVSVNMALVSPKEKAYPDGGGKTKMQQQNFLIPSIFYVTPISEKMALGIGVASSWGLATEWAQDSFARYSATRTSLQNEDYTLAMAYQLNDQWSVGMGVTIDQSQIEKEKKLFQGGTDANFKLQGDNLAAGFQASALYKLNSKHQFGLQYSSEIRRKYHGKVHLDGLNDAALSTIYAGYGVTAGSFPNASYETDVVSKSSLPQSIDLGYCYRPTEKLTLNADVLWMGWNSTKEEELAYPNETDPGRLAFLNIGNPANRDWHSAVSLGLGAEYKVVDRLRLRGGYFFHQSPVPQSTWEPNMPDADSHSVAMGFGYDITKALTLDLTESVMFFDARSVKNDIADGVGGSIDAKYTQWTNLVLATLTYKF